MTEKRKLNWYNCHSLVEEMANRIIAEVGGDGGTVAVYGIPRGGIPVALLLMQHGGFRITDAPEDAEVFVDDLIDSGATKAKWEKQYPGTKFFALVDKKDRSEWFVFPWETGTEDLGPEENIRRLLEYIGEDVNREGLLETPKRILKSYTRLYGGYKQRPEDLMKVFTEGACDEMVVLKDIRFYSTCEHHMLPFFGVAHVAYIPNGKVVGVSKLARLVDMYARRMQIQERLGSQVVDAIMNLLGAKGAACIIEAQHFCMTSRGVENQTAKMVTSALRGAFKENSTTRAEFMSMIREG